MVTLSSIHPLRSAWSWLGVLSFVALVFSSARAEPIQVDAEAWKAQQLNRIAAEIQEARSEDERLEFVARQNWLQHWEPGRMSSAPAESQAKSGLVDEPLLDGLRRPTDVQPQVWQQMVSSQAKLIGIDTDEDRKGNLREIIVAAGQLEKLLSEQLPPEAQELPAPTAWALAHTRYRLGRALAYRELPSVREQWPIADPVQYEKRLLAAYQRLLDQTEDVRPEFILLEDRVLRRSGRKGLALQLLESHQGMIEQKWYLKKRRDLLEELGWGPPHQEAAQIYYDAGYRDDP